jgi:hypothetical protein
MCYINTEYPISPGPRRTLLFSKIRKNVKREESKQEYFHTRRNLILNRTPRYVMQFL